MNSFIKYYQSPIGLIRISGTDSLVREVSFIDDENQLLPESANPPALAIQCIEELIQYFHGSRKTFDLPVDQDGSPFQKKVWYELLNIPYGKTISYLELSRKLGDVKAIRAAASANGRNQLAIIVPCHRVIGSRSDLVGYAGGLWRKKYLLSLETRIAHGVQTLF